MYLDIGDHGVIGNLRTAALVGRNGTIDWCCFPSFHSPSVFAGLLDDESGGQFAIDLIDGSPVQQYYEPKTNVLHTTLATQSGEICITDFMPVFMNRGELTTTDEIIRLVQCTEGQVTVRITFTPQLDYARGETTLDVVDAGCLATNRSETLTLVSPIEFDIDDHGTTSTVDLHAEEELLFVCRYGESNPDRGNPEIAHRKLEHTKQYWEHWSNRCEYDGPWEEAVLRSALTLKLLTDGSTGALVAAATTSLPEIPGGTRNWDYRYTWIRDAIFSDWSVYQLGYHELGIQFQHLLHRILDPEAIPPLVDIEGNPVPDEERLDHLDGYRGTSVIRIGNAAADQNQWGSYGALVDGIYFSHRELGGVNKTVYEDIVRPVVEYICTVWNQPDYGIWEVRGEKRHFTTSKMWCWVALDRGIKIAAELGYRDDVERWQPHRATIREDIFENGWSETLDAFKIAYGTEALDASVLLMPLVGFLPARHSKMKRTIESIEENLSAGPLLYRYRPEEVDSDSIDSDDSTFTTCSFWLVACLTRLGRTDEARDLFECLLNYSNHLGLYAEELDPETGTQWGNFPQAYVHMGVINAAVELSQNIDHK